MFKNTFIILLLILSTDLFSQNCNGKDFSRSIWFEKDTISTVNFSSESIESEITISGDLIEIINFNHIANVKFDLFNINGKQIVNGIKPDEVSADLIKIKLDKIDISKGLYLLRLRSKDKIYNYKLILEK